jgi:hypothetical protein
MANELMTASNSPSGKGMARMSPVRASARSAAPAVRAGVVVDAPVPVVDVEAHHPRAGPCEEDANGGASGPGAGVQHEAGPRWQESGRRQLERPVDAHHEVHDDQAERCPHGDDSRQRSDPPWPGTPDGEHGDAPREDEWNRQAICDEPAVAEVIGEHAGDGNPLPLNGP